MRPPIHSWTPSAILAAGVGGCGPAWLDPIDTDYTTGTTVAPGTSTAGETTSTGGVPTSSSTGATTTTTSGTTDTADPSTTGLTGSVETTGSETTTAGPMCIPESYQQCSDGDVHWFDTCDVEGAVVEACGESGPLGGPYCQDGDVWGDQEVRGCQDAACTSEIASVLLKDCDEAGCSDGACLGCALEVTKYACPEFSEPDGLGEGGGNLFAVCGAVGPGGVMMIRARKPNRPNQMFGTRPYQVRVSPPDEEACGPNAWFFVVSDDAPSGIGSEELEFTFASIWLPGQVEKGYCVTASTTPGDLGYDSNDSGQQSWWWSEKIVLTRTCL